MSSQPMSQEQPVLDTLVQMAADTYERSGLDPKTFMLVRIAALAAVDAPPLSYLTNLKIGKEIGLTAKDVQSTLVAIAPVIGGPRVVSSASKITRALGLAIKIAENKQQQELADAD